MADKPQAIHEDHVREILKCGRDVSYFCNTHVKIQHPIKGLLSFKTYKFQDDCLRAFAKNRFNVVVKSRQLGLSTVTAAYAVWLAIFHKDKNILVIATKLPVAINFIKKVKVVLQNLPKWLMLPQITNDTKQSVAFSNGSQIKAIPTSADAGRSEALSVLICDEAAWIPDFEELYTGLYSTVSEGGSAILISTPNGVGGKYHQIYAEAEAGLNSYNAIKLPWYVHPEHDQEWFNKETKNMSPKAIAQELMCDFVASGATFLQIEDLSWVKSIIEEPSSKEGVDRCIWVWKKPEQGKKYLVTADIARGDGSDFSTFHVTDYIAGEVVAEYKGKIPPDRFATLLVEWGTKYNKAMICPELNSLGYTTCSKLKELKYPNLYYEKMKNMFMTYVPSQDEVPGLSTSGVTRPQMLAKLEEALRNKRLRILSSRFASELNTFVWKGSRAEAMKGHNDDLIISLAINAYLVDYGGAGKSDTTMMDALLKSTKVEAKSLNSKAPGINPYHGVLSKPSTVYRPVQSPHSGIPGMFDFRWLLK